MLIENIAMLVGAECEAVTRRSGISMNSVPLVENAWLRVNENGRVDGFGSGSVHPLPGEVVEDAGGGFLLPSFCDSHTHIIYAGTREHELAYKNQGLDYEQIAALGGGILNTVDRLRSTSEECLYEQSLERAREVMSKGTGLIEIKSGYGLSVVDELKMLRVIARISEAVPMEVRSTFLGAHAVPREYAGNREGYVDYICRKMIPAVAAEGLASYVDVFCDRGYFTPQETLKIMEAGAGYGLRSKIHANELAVSGGVQAGVAGGALSVDHLERMGNEEISLLAGSETVATMLPGASFFLDIEYAPALKAINSGATVALASDYNPGSSPSGDMRFVMSLGCIKMKLTTAQALNAVTINGAAAMDMGAEFGSLAVGKVANFIITKPMASLDFIPYAYNTLWIRDIYLRGKRI